MSPSGAAATAAQSDDSMHQQFQQQELALALLESGTRQHRHSNAAADRSNLQGKLDGQQNSIAAALSGMLSELSAEIEQLQETQQKSVIRYCLQCFLRALASVVRHGAYPTHDLGTRLCWDLGKVVCITWVTGPLGPQVL